MTAEAAALSVDEKGPHAPNQQLAATRPPRGRRKRMFDVALGSVLLVALAPLLLVLAVLVRLDSPGPVLFTQERVGRDGRRITIHKFRTMVAGAERMRPHLERLNEAGDGPLFKVRNDPRITRVGRWLRRTSLDELPQLLNVLGGSMSLVGPRPALPEEVAQYPTHAHRRHDVKPGMTGLWQVSGRSDLSWEDGLHLDLQYVQHHSVLVDLIILVRTVPAVVLGRGAY